MKVVLPKACHQNGCREIVRDGNSYCSTHRAGRKTPRRANNNDPFYFSKKWKILSSNHKIKNPWCQYCKADAVAISDHYIELNDGGADMDERNILSACHSCHRQKTMQVARARESGGLKEWYLSNIKTHECGEYVKEHFDPNYSKY